jgi:hypothetical protein
MKLSPLRGDSQPTSVGGLPIMAPCPGSGQINQATRPRLIREAEKARSFRLECQKGDVASGSNRILINSARIKLNPSRFLS